MITIESFIVKIECVVDNIQMTDLSRLSDVNNFYANHV
jgi:hypothetical protein